MVFDPDKLPEKESEESQEQAEVSKQLHQMAENVEHEHNHKGETQEDIDKSAEKILSRIGNTSSEIKEMAEHIAAQVRRSGLSVANDMRSDLEDMILEHTEDLDSILSPEDAKELYQILYGEKFEGEAPMSSRIPGNKGYEAEKAKMDEKIRLETEKRNKIEEEAMRRGQENIKRMGEEARQREAEWLKQRAEKRALEEQSKLEEQRKSRWFGLGRFFR